MTIDRLIELLTGDGYLRRYLSGANYTYRKGGTEFRGDIDADSRTVRTMTGYIVGGPGFTDVVTGYPTEAQAIVMMAVATTHRGGSQHKEGAA